jgi:multicomponent K+:H+ antiporter subunit G
MHAPTLGTTLGTGCVLIASMLVSSALLERPVLHEVLMALFLVITTPITAILLMRAAIYRGRARSTAANEPVEPGPDHA